MTRLPILFDKIFKANSFINVISLPRVDLAKGKEKKKVVG